MTKKRMCPTEGCDLLIQMGNMCGRCKKEQGHDCHKFIKKHGKNSAGNQQYSCKNCNKTWVNKRDEDRESCDDCYLDMHKQGIRGGRQKWRCKECGKVKFTDIDT